MITFDFAQPRNSKISNREAKEARSPVAVKILFSSRPLLGYTKNVIRVPEGKCLAPVGEEHVISSFICDDFTYVERFLGEKIEFQENVNPKRLKWSNTFALSTSSGAHLKT